MSRPLIVGLAGNLGRPSKTRMLVETAALMAARRFGAATEVHDLTDVGPSLGTARRRGELDAQGQAVIERIVGADALIVGSPTYKGSYAGLFKHLIDLIEPAALRGKPVLLTATGGGERHALMVEHQLRPLFGFFMAHTLPSAVFASDRDFLDHWLTPGPVRDRLEGAVLELAPFLAGQPGAGSARIVAAE